MFPVPDDDDDDDDEAALPDDQDDQDAEEPEAVDLRMSKRHQGELARRMAAVEDRAQHATDQVLLPLLAASGMVAQDLVNLWAGYGRFCRSRIGIRPDEMMRAWEMPLLEDVEQVLSDYEHVEPQPAKVAEYARYCCTAWDRRFGGPEEDGDGE